MGCLFSIKRLKGEINMIEITFINGNVIKSNEDIIDIFQRIKSAEFFILDTSPQNRREIYNVGDILSIIETSKK